MRKTGNGTVKRSEESIMLMTPYRFPHHGNRSFTFVQDDVLPLSLTTVIDPLHSLRMTINVSRTTTADPLLLFRMTPNGNHMLRLLTHSSQLAANGLQLTAITLFAGRSCHLMFDV